MKIYEWINKNVQRGACRCGRCIDAVENPEEEQPEGHTADVFFFEVAVTETATKEELESILIEEYPSILNGLENNGEHNYMNLGATLGDQGTALMLMGAGSLLKLWTLVTPMTLGIPRTDPLANVMAGTGFVIIIGNPPDE